MSADTYYMLWCLGLIGIALVVIPCAFSAGRHFGRHEAERLFGKRLEDACAAERDRVMRASRCGKWLEDEHKRQEIARAETVKIARES